MGETGPRDFHAELAAIGKKIGTGSLAEAESELAELERRASEAGDTETLDLVLSEFVFLYSHPDQLRLAKAEEYALRREKLSDSGYACLRTTMMFFYVARDYPRTVTKCFEATEKSRADGNDSALYQSLALLGQVLLELDRTDEARNALTEIERMVVERKRIVVGDETCFLESATRKNIELGTVKRIAAMLVPWCRDSEFRKRLQNLI